MSLRRVLFLFLKLLIFLFGLNASAAQLTSFRVENVESLSSVSSDGRLTLFAEDTIAIRIFSNKQLNSKSQISFTNIVNSIGSDCDDSRKSNIYDLYSVDNNTALAKVIFTKSDAMLDGYLMFCYRFEEHDPIKKTNWIHQGNNSWMRISLQVKNNHMETVMVWVKSVLVPIFILLSAIFSGLSLTLLTLTRAELKVMRNQGKSEEKRYSKAVTPLRKRGNILFCGLLLLNILANVVVVVLLYELIQLYSILAATFLIVLFGELVPQTICSKYGLGFGNKMSWLTDIFFVLTLPFSYPVGKVMDLVLDDEVPAVYNRDRFQEILARPGKSLDPAGITSTTNPAVSEEIRPFKLSNRTVGEVMVKLEDAYMEEYDSILTSEKVLDILKRGYTRIPVYEKERSNVVALLHVRDLTLIDPKDRLTLKAVCKFYNRPVNFVFEDTKLTVMLEEFKKGQSHMAFVQRVNNDGPGDPYYETLGMITLEDVIEDIFHSDSVASKQLVANTFDPQIHFQNNKITSDMQRLKFNQYLSHHKKQKSDDENQIDSLPSNLLEAIKHFLPTVPAFHQNLISPSVLERLLSQCSVMKGTNQDASSSHETQDGPDKNQPIVEKGRPMDFFVLVLEGKVKVTIGADDLKFVEGSFAHFGLPVLMKALPDLRLLPAHLQGSNQNPPSSDDQSEYVPDFSVHPIGEVLYLKMPLSVYLSSLQATQLQRMNHGIESTSDVSMASQADNHHHHHHAMRNKAYEEGETFVEANNAKNAFLNFRGYPELYPSNYGILPPDYPYHLHNEAAWTSPQPRGVANLSGSVLQTKSPSDEWLDRHCKGDADSSRSQEPVSDRSMVADDFLPHSHSFTDDHDEMDRTGC